MLGCRGRIGAEGQVHRPFVNFTGPRQTARSIHLQLLHTHASGNGGGEKDAEPTSEHRGPGEDEEQTKVSSSVQENIVGDMWISSGDIVFERCTIVSRQEQRKASMLVKREQLKRSEEQRKARMMVRREQLNR